MKRRALQKGGASMVNGASEAIDAVEQYFANHPRSPSAVRRPKVSKQGDTFIALLGRDVQHGIVGLGNTVDNALRAFDSQYLSALRPPEVHRAPSGTRSGKVKAALT
jgi:hypothetical protein